jgi:hypothetical protein
MDETMRQALGQRALTERLTAFERATLAALNAPHDIAATGGSR